jgi:hypothetical protein
VPADQGQAAQLQELLDQELGPPKFTVPKLPLETLLEQEMGPPKFAIPKSGSMTQQAAPTPAVLDPPMPMSFSKRSLIEHVLLPEPRKHLRLEVLNGPDAGKIFDTLDSASQVRAAHSWVMCCAGGASSACTVCPQVHIGRVLECSLALGNDPEISSRHAIIQFSMSDKCWKLVRVL